MADEYELSVYADEVEVLLSGVLHACAAASTIRDRRARSCIIASALMTAAQVLDGNDMPRESKIVRPGGVAATLAILMAGKNPPGC